MSGDHERAGFEALAAAGADDSAAATLARKLKSGVDGRDLEALAALWLHCAAAAPERTPGLFDAAAEGWFGQPVEGPPIRTAGPAPETIPRMFWNGLWALGGPRGPLEAANLTSRTAALSSSLAPAITQRVARATLAYPEIPRAVSRGLPEPIKLDTLRRCPPDSLAGVLYRKLSEDGFELEPPDRSPLKPEVLPRPLDYVHARLLQCHDIWHIVAGYQTTALHEVAISAFQLAQFGHHASAMFLAVVLTRLAFERPQGGPILLETILAAWAHGRKTPSLLPVRWESMWDQSVDGVRAKLGVTAYASPFPPDLLDQPNRPADAA